MKTVVGIYDTVTQARDVVDDLVDAGLRRDDISLISPDPKGRYADYVETEDTEDTGDAAAEGAIAGGVIGGLAGVLVGLGAFAIPGIGPIVAAGPIVAGLVGAGVGAAAGGLLGALVEWGVPEEEAEYYTEAVRRGSTLVAVRVADELVDDVVDIMERHDPVDVEKRAEYWREQGWTGYEAEVEPYTTAEIEAEREAYAAYDVDELDEEVTIPIVEEEMRVGKRAVETGRVRVHTHVEERPVEEDVRLREERVTVQRRPADRPADEADIDTFEEGTFEVTEMGEEVVAEKRARVIEEVVIGKDVAERTETVRGTVRHTEVDVDETDEEWDVDVEAFETYQPTFRRHYDTNFATTGYTYTQYEPAYRYGYDLATHPDYRERDWQEIEPEARRRWEERNRGTWEQFKAAVRHGWEELEDAFD